MLSEHKMQHQNRPEFQCLECDFMGNTNYQLKRHMRIHVSNSCESDSMTFRNILFTLSVNDRNVDKSIATSVR